MSAEFWDNMELAMKELTPIIRNFVFKEVDIAKQELRDDTDALEAKVAELSREVAGLKTKERKGWLR